jgi:hypothetical protein
LRSDEARAPGTRYTPGTLIGADAVLRDYFQWLADVNGGDDNDSAGTCPWKEQST